MKKNTLRKKIYSSEKVEVFYDDLKETEKAPKWMREILFDNNLKTEKKDKENDKSA